jgi:hypothetical protein
MISVNASPASPAEDLEELQAIIGSITFES